MATSARLIETPVGSKLGGIVEKLEILGVASYLTQTQNQPNDAQLRWEEKVTIEVPVGTWMIVPVPNTTVLGHGRLSPDLLDPTQENQVITWEPYDRSWGLGWAQVSVIDLNAPDLSVSPPKQTAQLLVVMHLSDYNADDPWFGFIGYALMFLGKAPRQADQKITTDLSHLRKTTLDMKGMR